MPESRKCWLLGITKKNSPDFEIRYNFSPRSLSPAGFRIVHEGHPSCATLVVWREQRPRARYPLSPTEPSNKRYDVTSQLLEAKGY